MEHRSRSHGHDALKRYAGNRSAAPGKGMAHSPHRSEQVSDRVRRAPQLTLRDPVDRRVVAIVVVGAHELPVVLVRRSSDLPRPGCRLRSVTAVVAERVIGDAADPTRFDFVLPPVASSRCLRWLLGTRPLGSRPSVPLVSRLAAGTPAAA